MSSNRGLTDAGIGNAVASTNIQLSLKAVKVCVFLGMVIATTYMYLSWYMGATQKDIDLVKIGILSSFGNEQPKKWRVYGESGEREIVSVIEKSGREVRVFTNSEIRQVLKPMWRPVDKFKAVAFEGAISGVLSGLLIWMFLSSYGSGRQESKRIRGAFELVAQSELKRMVKKNGASGYTLADMPLPSGSPQQGVNIMGAPGSGKSAAIHDLMQQVFEKKGRKSIIYDQAGEYYAAYFRPGKDFFFNPALQGSVNWSIFGELSYDYDADKLAQAFLPPKKAVSAGSGAFFEDAARALFSVILLRLTKRGAVNTKDLARAFLEMPAEEMEHLIKGSVASSAVGGDSKGQRQGVIASIAIYLNGIQAVGDGMWTLKKFFEDESDARLFIVNTEDTKAMFAPLYRLMLTIAFNTIAAKAKIIREDKFWFFLDESYQLGDIRLDEQAATLRKFGVCIVNGIQSDAQFVEAMSETRADVVLNCFSTHLMLRGLEQKMQERMSARIGTMEVDAVSRNQQLAVTEWRDGAGLNVMQKNEVVVMPSDFGTLGNLEGYIKLSGKFPSAKVDYSEWLKPWFFGIFGSSRVQEFSPVQDLPMKNPAFKIGQTEISDDPLGDISKEVKDKKAASEGEDAGGDLLKRPDQLVKLMEVKQEEKQDEIVMQDTGEIVKVSELENKAINEDPAKNKIESESEKNKGEENEKKVAAPEVKQSNEAAATAPQEGKSDQEPEQLAKPQDILSQGWNL